MPVNPGLAIAIPSGQPYYRITSLAFKTASTAAHRRVVDGQGAVNSRHGARYNYPGARTVYLTEDIETCLAEKMFYFQREVVRGMDMSHHLGVIPPFQQTFVLWEIILKRSVPNVYNMDVTGGGAAFFNIFPSLTLNPSQDYEHLKDRRADIESNGYTGLRVKSSRATRPGNMIVLFNDQSNNVQSITPYDIELRLIDIHGQPFYNHATEILDFTTGQVRIPGSTFPSAGGSSFSSWRIVNFNH